MATSDQHCLLCWKVNVHNPGPPAALLSMSPSFPVVRKPSFSLLVYLFSPFLLFGAMGQVVTRGAKCPPGNLLAFLGEAQRRPCIRAALFTAVRAEKLSESSGRTKASGNPSSPLPLSQEATSLETDGQEYEVPSLVHHVMICNQYIPARFKRSPLHDSSVIVGKSCNLLAPVSIWKSGEDKMNSSSKKAEHRTGLLL